MSYPHIYLLAAMTVAYLYFLIGFNTEPTPSIYDWEVEGL